MKQLLTIGMALACLSAGEELTLADGTALHDARVLRQDGESVTIAHASGVLRVTHEQLTPEQQQRFGLTPEAVAERQQQAANAAQAKALAREKKLAQQRAALAESGLSPRYLTGADVIALYSAWTTLTAPAAEYLAAEWNRREALRCGLTVEAARYKSDAAELLTHARQEQEAVQKKQEQAAALESALKDTREQLRRARATIKELQEKTDRQQQERTTVIVSQPTYVPVYRPAPVILPPVRRMPPPRPQPPPRPMPPPAPKPLRPAH